MSCISSNFSSFFLDSLNDPSEFAKYLSNGENKFSPFEEFQAFGSSTGSSYSSNSALQQQYSQQQQQNFNGNTGYYNNSAQVNNALDNAGNGIGAAATSAGGQNHQNSDLFNSSLEANNLNQHHHSPTLQQQHLHQQLYAAHHPSNSNYHHNQTSLPSQLPSHSHPHPQTHHQSSNSAQCYATPIQHRWTSPANTPHHVSSPAVTTNLPAPAASAQHFDGSFEFLKYLRHSNDYSGSASNSSNSVDDAPVPTTSTSAANQSSTAASLIDLDSSTSMKPCSSRKAVALLSSATRAATVTLDNTLDIFDHDDDKHIFDLQHHITSNSNSNEESSMDISNLAFPNSLLNASNSNTSSESAAGGSGDFSAAPKPLANFTLKENFEVHPSHKVEEGIFQHMNKLPTKKKETLKQLGVRFTGQMTLSDKSIIVDNFIKFCQEYEITDHRPYLSLNQSGLNKSEQIKFARYLGQGLPSFTLFCIYSNFKNLFCTKRIENYTKDGYNLPYILEKTKRFLSNTTSGGSTTTPNKQIPPHCAPPTPLHTSTAMGPTF